MEDMLIGFIVFDDMIVAQALECNYLKSDR